MLPAGAPGPRQPRAAAAPVQEGRFAAALERARAPRADPSAEAETRRPGPGTAAAGPATPQVSASLAVVEERPAPVNRPEAGGSHHPASGPAPAESSRAGAADSPATDARPAEPALTAAAHGWMTPGQADATLPASAPIGAALAGGASDGEGPAISPAPVATGARVEAPTQGVPLVPLVPQRVDVPPETRPAADAPETRATVVETPPAVETTGPAFGPTRGGDRAPGDVIAERPSRAPGPAASLDAPVDAHVDDQRIVRAATRGSRAMTPPDEAAAPPPSAERPPVPPPAERPPVAPPAERPPVAPPATRGRQPAPQADAARVASRAEAQAMLAAAAPAERIAASGQVPASASDAGPYAAAATPPVPQPTPPVADVETASRVPVESGATPSGHGGRSGSGGSGDQPPPEGFAHRAFLGADDRVFAAGHAWPPATPLFARALEHAGAAPGSSLPPAHGAAVQQQVVRGMFLQVRQGGGAARIRLSPEHLGEVVVEMRVHGDRVTATLRADTATVRAWIARHESDLRAGLADVGLQLDELQVREREEQPRDGHETPEPRPRRRPRAQAGDQPRFEVEA
jgi:hypothetical protein